MRTLHVRSAAAAALLALGFLVTACAESPTPPPEPIDGNEDSESEPDSEPPDPLVTTMSISEDTIESGDSLDIRLTIVNNTPRDSTFTAECPTGPAIRAYRRSGSAAELVELNGVWCDETSAAQLTVPAHDSLVYTWLMEAQVRTDLAPLGEYVLRPFFPTPGTDIEVPLAVVAPTDLTPTVTLSPTSVVAGDSFGVRISIVNHTARDTTVTAPVTCPFSFNVYQGFPSDTTRVPMSGAERLFCQPAFTDFTIPARDSLVFERVIGAEVEGYQVDPDSYLLQVDFTIGVLPDLQTAFEVE